VIRPFGLHDIWLVRRLQHTGMTLAVEHMLTHPHEPLWTALTAPWPWAGVGVATFVLDEPARAQGAQGQPLQGFAQLMKRASRPEADLLHVAPAASSTAGDPYEVIWSRLLAHCSLAAATHGLQRVYASAPEGCFEQSSLRQAGFCLYARETLYRLAETPPSSETLIGLRPQLPRDSWSLQRLYARSTPRLVQQAEGALDGEVGTPILSWWDPHEWEGHVWEPAGEVRGAVQAHRGRAGHWLRVLGAGELSAREVRLLIAQGLRSLEGARSRAERRRVPVYVTVREYDANLSGALIGFGFAPFAERARFVKHTAAVVRVAEPLQASVARPAAREMARNP
jgi:hypothetical protein